MGLFDHPKIDKAAENCKAAENKFEFLFQEKNSFIPRPDFPDKGCDYVVEIVVNRDVKNWRFQVQLKSIQTLTIVGKHFIAYSIETSRLGYLLRNMPQTGLIIFYSEENDNLYFDYIEKIYNRIKSNHDTDAWTEQDTVTIHIPLENVINRESLREIHTQIIVWSKEHEKLILSHGDQYDLPVVRMADPQDFDINDPGQVKDILRKHGLSLIYHFQLSMIRQMLEKIPPSDLINDQTIAIVAAVAYCEIGMHFYSNFLIEGITWKGNLSTKDQTILNWTALKNDYGMGKVDSPIFVERATAIGNQLPEGIDKATIEVNIITHAISQIKPLENFPPDLPGRIEAFFNQLTYLQTDEAHINHLYIWNTENYAHYISLIRTKQLSYYDLSKALDAKIQLSEKMKTIQFILYHQNILINKINTIHKKAEENNNSLLSASCQIVRQRYYLVAELDYINFSERLQEIAERHKPFFQNHIRISMDTYNKYLKNGYERQAYNALCIALEFLYISRNIYQYQDNFDEDELLDFQQHFEATLHYEPYELLSKKALEKKQAKENAHGDMSYLLQLNDQQLENLARQSHTLWNLPESHFVHIMNELKSYKIFHTRCTDKNIEIFPCFPFQHNILLEYSQPTQFVLKNKTTGLTSTYSSDVHSLLISWGY